MAKDASKMPAGSPSMATPQVGNDQSPAAPVVADTAGAATNDVAGDTPPAPSDPPPAGVVSVDPARLDRLEGRLDQALNAIERRDRLLDAAGEELERLRGELERARSQPVSAVIVDQQKAMLERFNREVEERNEAAARIEADVLAGPLKFNCSMSKQPRMSKVVGAASELEARSKYFAYFGINGTVDSGISFGCTPVE